MSVMNNLSIVIVICYSLISGCVIPVPLHSDENISKVEWKIKRLNTDKASRDQVIDTLGPPSRKTPETDPNKEISYLVCEKVGGVGVAVIAGGNYGAVSGFYEEFRGDKDCYEFVLGFGRNDQLAEYRKTPFTGTYQLPNGRKLDVLRSMALKGFPEHQWRLYDESGRRPEDVIWLCRSADNGFTKAQLDVGHKYWASRDIPKHKIKAFVWYRLATAGDKYHEGAADRKTLSRAVRAMKESLDVLNKDQLVEAYSLYSVMKPGDCELELADKSTR